MRTTTFQVHLPLAGLGRQAPTRSTFVRRRVGALTFAVALVVSVGSVAQHGLADRGDDPASVSAVGRSVTYVGAARRHHVVDRRTALPGRRHRLGGRRARLAERRQPRSRSGSELCCPDRHPSGPATLAAHAMSPLSCRRHQGDRLTRVRRRRSHPSPSVVPAVQPSLHHLRTARDGAAGHHQVQRRSPAVRPGQDRGRRRRRRQGPSHHGRADRAAWQRRSRTRCG